MKNSRWQISSEGKTRKHSSGAGYGEEDLYAPH